MMGNFAPGSNFIKGLNLITHNVAVQLNEPSVHLQIVEEMCSYKV